MEPRARNHTKRRVKAEKTRRPVDEPDAGGAPGHDHGALFSFLLLFGEAARTVQVVTWNENFRKLTTSDQHGLIIVSPRLSEEVLLRLAVCRRVVCFVAEYWAV